MSAAPAGKALLFVESNTSGTGRLFARTARKMGFVPVLITARPGKYAYLAEEGAPEVVVVPRVDEDELHALVAARWGGAAGVAGITSSSAVPVCSAVSRPKRASRATSDRASS